MSEAQRWGIWIDIEGFSNLWETMEELAVLGLRRLTSMIFALGTRCFPDHQSRLFAHHSGDAFYISSDFHEASLDRCASIAVVLMRGLTEVGCVARASIGEGPIADYAGCRPEEVRAAASTKDDSGFVPLGMGVMTLQSVMGLGLINAYGLDKKADTKGAILLVPAAMRARLSPGFATRPLERVADILAIDWVHSTSPIIDAIAAKLGFGAEDPTTLRGRLESYVDAHGLKATWSVPTFRYCGF